MDQSQNPSYLIYGAGALGSVLGGFLQKIGRPVTYVGRGAHFQALQEHGLKITGIWGDHFIPPEEIDALTSPEASRKRYSTILLCVKSKDTETAASRAAPLLQEDGIMVSIQNGLNNWETIARQCRRRAHCGRTRHLWSRDPNPWPGQGYRQRRRRPAG